VTKVGVVRDERGGWLPANSPQSLREQVHDNLRRLGLDVLDVVNLRTLAGIDDRATVSDTLTPQFEALAELQQQGLIRHLGVSTVSLDQLAEAQQIAAVVYVQNFYNIANRADAAVLAATAEQHIAYVPYFPLGGFSPLQSDVLESVATRLGATSTAVAQSWLLQHSPNMMLIPGTSSVDHLRENIAGAALALPPDALAELDAIGAVDPAEGVAAGRLARPHALPRVGTGTAAERPTLCAPPQAVRASRLARPHPGRWQGWREPALHGRPREVGSAVLGSPRITVIR
jgi:aryl-alcohol dehydrogenase-like predicted oxidoreductase